MTIPLDDNVAALKEIRTTQEICEVCPARAAWKFISPESKLELTFCSHHSRHTPVPPDWQEVPL